MKLKHQKFNIYSENKAACQDFCVGTEPQNYWHSSADKPRTKQPLHNQVGQPTTKIAVPSTTAMLMAGTHVISHKNKPTLHEQMITYT